MKRLTAILLSALLCLSLLTACTGGGESSSGSGSPPGVAQPMNYKYQLDSEGVTVHDEWIDSRGIQIPATLTLPAGQEGDRVPLVIFSHDFLGDRSTGGAFEEMALALAEQGVASITVDFSGCGDSTEDFSASSLLYMESDLKSARNYAIENAPIDSERIGLFGYGLGGRVALEMAALKDSPYTAVSLLAPMTAAPEATMRSLLGDSYDTLRAQAFSEQRSAEYTGPDGVVRTLSVNWFDDIDLSQPLKNMQHLKGAMQVLYTPGDTVVPQSVITQLTEASQAGSASLLVVGVPDTDHGFGLTEEGSAPRAQVVEAVSSFFAQAFAE